MELVDTLTERSGAFARDGFLPGLKIIPSQKTMIVGCVDPRVDPMDIFRLKPGEAAVIRNVGGRVNPGLLETLAILSTVSRAAGQMVGAGWNLIVLHHTDCGIIGCFHHAPDLLATYMGVAPDGLADLAVTDPYEAVVRDVAALRNNPHVSGKLTISGLVYDVADGRITVVVPPSTREAAQAGATI